MEARLLNDKLKKTREKVAKILEKKSSTSLGKLESLVSFFSFAVNIVRLSQTFFQRLYD